MRTTATHYRLVAEMDDHAGVPAGVFRWLGLDPYPRWTDEAHAIEFATPQGLCQFYHAGNGFPFGLFCPKAGTVRIVKRIIQTTVTLHSRRLPPFRQPRRSRRAEIRSTTTGAPPSTG